MTDSISHKKLPACDYCKNKRVICHPQQVGSCPRCLEKGVICKTTPVVRRKRRTRAQLKTELAQSHILRSSESSEPTTSDTRSSSPYIDVPSIWKEPSLLPNVSSLDLPPSLIKQLFQEFRLLPYSYHPLLPIGALESSLNRCSWHLPTLPPQLRVFAHCVIAVTARISESAHIIGPAHNIPELFEKAPPNTRLLDCREFGQRRDGICEQLRAEAVWLAQHEGVMIMPCVSNAASLELLEFLEYRASGKGGNAYSAGYIHHLRDISDEVYSLDPTTQTIYSAFLMRSALCSVTTGSIIPFTQHDERLICGEDPCSLQEVLRILSSESCLPLSSVMRPMTFHMIRLSRQISECFTGKFAQRRPLDEAKLISQLNELDLLHTCVAAGVEQMEKLRYTTIEEELFQYMRLCVYPLLNGYGALVLLLFEELKRRRELIRVSLGDESTNGGMLRMQARIDLLYAQVRSMTSHAVLKIAAALMEVPGISRITHVNFSNLNKWARFLLEDADVLDLTLAQRVEALERLRSGLNLFGFSWIDRTGTVEAIDEFIASTRAIQEITDITSVIWSPAEGDFAAWIQSSLV